MFLCVCVGGGGGWEVYTFITLCPTVVSFCGVFDNHFSFVIIPKIQDYTPTTLQNAVVGGAASWHPGNRIHKRRSRMIAIAILRSMAYVFERWETPTPVPTSAHFQFYQLQRQPLVHSQQTVFYLYIFM